MTNCKICGDPDAQSETKFCNSCWEVDSRLDKFLTRVGHDYIYKRYSRLIGIQCGICREWTITSSCGLCETCSNATHWLERFLKHAPGLAFVQRRLANEPITCECPVCKAPPNSPCLNLTEDPDVKVGFRRMEKCHPERGNKE